MRRSRNCFSRPKLMLDIDQILLQDKPTNLSFLGRACHKKTILIHHLHFIILIRVYKGCYYLGNLFLHQSCPITAGISGRSSGSVASIHLSRVSSTLSTYDMPASNHLVGSGLADKIRTTTILSSSQEPTVCGTVNSPFPMFSNSLKMVSPSKGYSPVVKLYRVTPLKKKKIF